MSLCHQRMDPKDCLPFVNRQRGFCLAMESSSLMNSSCVAKVVAVSMVIAHHTHTTMSSIIELSKMFGAISFQQHLSRSSVILASITTKKRHELFAHTHTLETNREVGCCLALVRFGLGRGDGCFSSKHSSFRSIEAAYTFGNAHTHGKGS